MIAKDLIESVKVISKEAGAAILEIYDNEASIEVMKKHDDSPLTQADLAAHKIIVSALSRLTPDIPVLSEESADISWDERQSWSRYWLVDPLDGTKEFLKRNGEFTVNIALIDEHVPVLGVVYVPVNRVLYSGILGQGAFKECDGAEQQIKVVPVSHDITVVASRSHRSSELNVWIKKVEGTLGKVDLVSMGSSLKICLVAEGKADIYPRLALTSEWDTAAAQAVLEAAGGTLKDDEFNTYRYNKKEDLLNPFFFAIGDINFDWQRFYSD